MRSIEVHVQQPLKFLPASPWSYRHDDIRSVVYVLNSMEKLKNAARARTMDMSSSRPNLQKEFHG